MIVHSQQNGCKVSNSKECILSVERSYNFRAMIKHQLKHRLLSAMIRFFTCDPMLEHKQSSHLRSFHLRILKRFDFRRSQLFNCNRKTMGIRGNMRYRSSRTEIGHLECLNSENVSFCFEICLTNIFA